MLPGSSTSALDYRTPRTPAFPKAIQTLEWLFMADSLRCDSLEDPWDQLSCAGYV